MPEVIGIDHIYIAVSDLAASARFYDVLFEVLGFRKQDFTLDTEPHIQYYNRHFGYVLRPARNRISHDPYAPGLHHLCLRVESVADVQALAHSLASQNIAVTEPKSYPQYAPDYVAVHLRDPDGLRLEITNYREERRRRHAAWDAAELDAEYDAGTD
jgi:glyoxylase I family protein